MLTLASNIPPKSIAPPYKGANSSPFLLQLQSAHTTTRAFCHFDALVATIALLKQGYALAE